MTPSEGGQKGFLYSRKILLTIPTLRLAMAVFLQAGSAGEKRDAPMVLRTPSGTVQMTKSPLNSSPSQQRTPHRS